MKTVHVQYFAVLREARGISNESIQTEAESAQALYEELAARYRFPLGSSIVKAAIDGEFAPIDAPLTDGARVVFIPPVAGG